MLLFSVPGDSVLLALRAEPEGETATAAVWGEGVEDERVRTATAGGADPTLGGGGRVSASGPSGGSVDGMTVAAATVEGATTTAALDFGVVSLCVSYPPLDGLT